MSLAFPFSVLNIAHLEVRCKKNDKIALGIALGNEQQNQIHLEK